MVDKNGLLVCIVDIVSDDSEDKDLFPPKKGREYFHNHLTLIQIGDFILSTPLLMDTNVSFGMLNHANVKAKPSIYIMHDGSLTSDVPCFWVRQSKCFGGCNSTYKRVLKFAFI